MDLDAAIKSHGGRLTEIEVFIADIKKMMSGGGEGKGSSTDDHGELLVEIEDALPEIRKAIADTVTLADDIAAIRKDLAPALAWIAEQQKKDAVPKEVDTAAKPADPDKPLEHIADVEASLDAEADERSESEKASG